jgi:hypothetical protein
MRTGLCNKGVVTGICDKSSGHSQIHRPEISFNCLCDKTLAKGDLYKSNIYSKLNICTGGHSHMFPCPKNILQIKFEPESIKAALIGNIRSFILQYIARIEVYFGIFQMADLYPLADV